jgi:hypothetical protein
MGLDPHEGLAEVDEDGDVKDSVGVEVQVLDTVVLEETFEEVARRESQPARTLGSRRGSSPLGMDLPRRHTTCPSHSLGGN